MRYTLLLFYFVAFGPVVSAETAPSKVNEDIAEESVQDIFSNLMSPFCPGRLLRDCPSSSALQLKEQMLERIKKGETKEEITGSLLALYGDELKAVPPKHSFGLVGWLAPFVFLLVGIGVLGAWLQKRKGLRVTPPPSSGELSSELKEKIQRAVDSD